MCGFAIFVNASAPDAVITIVIIYFHIYYLFIVSKGISMFTFADLSSMQMTIFVPYNQHNKKSGNITYRPEEPYFTILSQDGRNIEIKSNNTGHCWNLIYEENTYTLMHKHDQKDNYHFQTIIGNLYDTILYIVGHDEYQMRNRNTVSVEEEKRSNSYFWKLIDIYGLTA